MVFKLYLYLVYVMLITILIILSLKNIKLQCITSTNDLQTIFFAGLLSNNRYALTYLGYNNDPNDDFMINFNTRDIRAQPSL
jgi:hypothetical protein